MRIEQLQNGSNAFANYCRLRMQLWPMDESHCGQECIEILGSPRWAVFIASLEAGDVVGFLEVNLREYAEGAETSPVGYLEGLYVAAPHRRQGLGAALVRAGEQWAAARGCTEIASDAQIDNAISIELHRRMGYSEIERQVCFLKRL